MLDAASITDWISSSVSLVVERKLIERVEHQLGRVPSNEEVAQHGRCFIGPVWTSYYWDDLLLFSYRVRLEGFRYVMDVTQLVEPLT